MCACSLHRPCAGRTLGDPQWVTEKSHKRVSMVCARFLVYWFACFLACMHVCTYALLQERTTLAFLLRCHLQGLSWLWDFPRGLGSLASEHLPPPPWCQNYKCVLLCPAFLCRFCRHQTEVFILSRQTLVTKPHPRPAFVFSFV